MAMSMSELAKSIDTSVLLEKPLSEWRPILAQECQVYVFGEQYLAKRFDQINYKFCEKIEAKEILIDNLYALLRYKYFPKSSEEIDERIYRIIQSFTANLKSTLKKVAFEADTDAERVYMLPNSCIAFRNGVFDFSTNDWLLKYDVIKIPEICNKIYMYDYTHIILWYVNIDFSPLSISINDTSVEEFIEIMKTFTKTDTNYCFELMYNMSHDVSHKFSIDMFKHLCEVIGYSILQDFSQNFVMFIGSGQNGKNSLYDGCFTSRVIPRATNNDLDAIENDKFITGALENRYQNIFLESSAKVYTESKMLKNITGSMYQTIEEKGKNKRSGFINCKHIFSANDQEKVKFADTTPGFKRRINVIEVWYKWDSSKRFLKKGDYYDTSFSDDFHEIKDNVMNTLIFIYCGMYGIKQATKNFKTNFIFSYNDWKLKYTDIDFELKDKIENISPETILKYIKSLKPHYEECKVLFYDNAKTRLYLSKTMKELGYNNYDDMISMFEDDAAFTSYFVDNDVYINVKLLQKLCGDTSSSTAFTQSLKKLYAYDTLPSFYNNQPYIKCTFISKKLKILK